MNTARQHATRSVGSMLVGATLRAASCAAFWVVLTGAHAAESWYIGVPTVAVATLATYRLAEEPGARIRPLGLLRFIPYFIKESVTGAIDVGLRAFHPSRPLAPAIVSYELRVPPESLAAVFFVEIISLLPGTLCTDSKEKSVDVHVVDRDSPVHEELAELEARVAAVFGEPLEPTSPDGGGA